MHTWKLRLIDHPERHSIFEIVRIGRITSHNPVVLHAKQTAFTGHQLDFETVVLRFNTVVIDWRGVTVEEINSRIARDQAMGEGLQMLEYNCDIPLLIRFPIP